MNFFSLSFLGLTIKLIRQAEEEIVGQGVYPSLGEALSIHRCAYVGELMEEIEALGLKRPALRLVQRTREGDVPN